MVNPFSDLIGKSAPALLGIAGVVVGIWAYFREPCAPIVILAFLTLAFAALLIGASLMPVRPTRARWLIESWVLAALAVSALATELVLHALMFVDNAHLLDAYGLSTMDQKEVTDLLKGAVSAAIAFVVTKDISEGSGAFSVAYQFKQAMRNASGLVKKPLAGPLPEDVADALLDDARPEEGWSFKVRGVRVAVVETYLRTP